MNYKKQAKLYYLYMMADGDISDGENKLFNQICEELHLEKYDKESIRQECANISMTCIEVIEKNAEKSCEYSILGPSMYSILGPSRDIWDIGLSKCISDDDKAKIIWNLVNLGYADSLFTFEEKEVVDYLREYWKLPDSLYQEMIDVAETCLALEKYKLWTEGLPDTEYKLEKLKQIKTDLKHVQENILTTISEINF